MSTWRLRKWLVTIGLLCFLLLENGCSQEKGEESFQAEILEKSDGYLMVRPLEGEEELKVSDRIEVSLNVVSAEGLPDVSVGDSIRVVYDGQIMETFPARVGTVYAIYRADEIDSENAAF